MAVKLGNGNWAVKEDKLLAYNDNSGLFFNKEFDFSRGTSATYVAKDGLIKTAGLQPNIVTNGDFATDSDWTKGSGWSISGGKAVGSATGASLYQADGANYTSGKLYKITFEVSDYVSGSVRPEITNVAGSYVSSNGVFVQYITATSSPIGAELKGSTFTGSVDNVTVQEIQTDTPRIDFTNDTKGHLLLEPSSTNVIENSEVTSTWTYTEFGSGSAGTITTGKTDMFGGTNAVQIDFPADTENVAFRFGQSTSSISSGSVATSVYIKLVENGSKTLQLRASSAVVSLINVNSTDFVRYEMTGTKNSSEAFNLKLRPSEGTSSGGFSIIICHPQEEALSYPTSYIPTTGAASTRNADVCNNSGSAQDFNSEEGVLYAEIAALADDGTSRQMAISDGSTSNRVILQYHNTSNLIRAVIVSGGSTQADMSFTVSDTTEFNKIAITYKQNDFGLWIGGVKRRTDLVGNAPSGLDRLNFDRGDGSTIFIQAKVRNVQVFTEALTDEQLENLTS